MNRDWHNQHKMPEHATGNERIAWHLEHTKNCACRPMPAGLLPKLSERQRSQIEAPRSAGKQR